MKFYDGTKRNRKQVFFPVWKEIFAARIFLRQLMQLILIAPYCQTAEHSLVRGQQWNNTATKNVESKNVEKPKQNLGDTEIYVIIPVNCLFFLFIGWLFTATNLVILCKQLIIAKLAGININIDVYFYPDLIIYNA